MKGSGNLGGSLHRVERFHVVSGIAVALFVAAALAVGSVSAGGPVEQRGGAGGSCPCPCTVICGMGVSCTCSGTKGHCYCGQVGLDGVERLAGVLDMEMRFSYSDWFDMAPLVRIEVALEAAMADTGQREVLRLRFVPSPEAAHTYRLEGSQTEWSGWLSRMDAARPARVWFAASGDDPATYVLRDGDPSHLNESLRKQLVIDSVTGPIVLFSSDSTIAWEIKSHLRSTVTCLSAAAVQGDLESARDALYGWIDSLDLLVKDLDLAGALAQLDQAGDRLARAGLIGDHPDSRRVLSAAGSVRGFLSAVDGKRATRVSSPRR